MIFITSIDDFERMLHDNGVEVSLRWKPLTIPQAINAMQDAIGVFTTNPNNLYIMDRLHTIPYEKEVNVNLEEYPTLKRGDEVIIVGINPPLTFGLYRVI